MAQSNMSDVSIHKNMLLRKMRIRWIEKFITKRFKHISVMARRILLIFLIMQNAGIFIKK